MTREEGARWLESRGFRTAGTRPRRRDVWQVWRRGRFDVEHLCAQSDEWFCGGGLGSSPQEALTALLQHLRSVESDARARADTAAWEAAEVEELLQ